MFDELDGSPEEVAVLNAALDRLCGIDPSDAICVLAPVIDLPDAVVAP
ncbi:MAG: hypothetical protein Q8M31_20175 [Beijerinckiaceae bacterium]|nr:hypothetical protein [Beijerinckiaceae bacterium]